PGLYTVCRLPSQSGCVAGLLNHWRNFDTSQEHPAVVPCPTASGMPPSVDLRYVRIVPFGSLFSRTPRTIPTAGYSAAIPVPIAIATGATTFASSPAYLQAAGVA